MTLLVDFCSPFFNLFNNRRGILKLLQECYSMGTQQSSHIVLIVRIRFLTLDFMVDWGELRKEPVNQCGREGLYNPRAVVFRICCLAALRKLNQVTFGLRVHRESSHRSCLEMHGLRQKFLMHVHVLYVFEKAYHKVSIHFHWERLMAHQ